VPLVERLRRRGRLAIVVAAVVIGLAGCGGGATSPHVAGLATATTVGSGGGHRTGSTTTTAPTGTATGLLNEWASCMRSHGDPHQADPTVDANREIVLTYPSGVDTPAQENAPACNPYLEAASTALRGGPLPSIPPEATQLKFSECMRAKGVPDFPDPGTGVPANPNASPGGKANTPAFQDAATVCAQKTGEPDIFGATPPAGGVRCTDCTPPPGGTSGTENPDG
jgi:hypothetical protein